MIKDIKDFVLRMVAGANVATALLMLAVGFSDRLDPVSHPLLANAGLVFPVLLALNLGFLVLWIFVRLRWVVIPFAALVLGFGPVRNYAPLNLSVAPADSCLKVVSFNVWNMGAWKSLADSCEMAGWLVEQDADIVCLQESGGLDWERQQHFLSLLADAYPEQLDVNYQASHMLLLSKHPILSHERIPYASSANFSEAFRLRVGQDTVTVIANHFESITFTVEEKEQVETIVKGNMETQQAETASRHLADKLVAASKRRAPQADSVAAYVRRHQGESIILCGDFNDSPISYVHRTIARELTDCYVAAGNGPGLSYHRNAIYVRIDNMFCSDDWKPVKCYVDSQVDLSDHYPIVCLLSKAQ